MGVRLAWWWKHTPPAGITWALVCYGGMLFRRFNDNSIHFYGLAVVKWQFVFLGKSLRFFFGAYGCTRRWNLVFMIIIGGGQLLGSEERMKGKVSIVMSTVF